METKEILRTSELHDAAYQLLDAINATTVYFPDDQERLDELAKLYTLVKGYKENITENNAEATERLLKQAKGYLVKLMPEDLSSVEEQAVCEDEQTKEPIEKCSFKEKLAIQLAVAAKSGSETMEDFSKIISTNKPVTSSPYQHRYRIVIEGSIENDTRKGVFGMVERMYKACGGSIRSIKVFKQ